MRIVQVCPWFEPYVGGVETHVATISTELVRRGHDVTVVTSRADPGLPENDEIRGIHVRRVKVRAVWQYKPVVIPNAVDLVRYRPENDGRSVRERLGIPGGESVVLSVGRMVEHKGIENLIEAARSVAYAKFVLVGGGPELGPMRRLAARLGVADRRTCTGRGPLEDLPSYFAACDVFVLPSVSRLEAFGIVALEAMASGKPVVVSDIPGVREGITDGKEGLLANPVDPEDLGGKIRILLADDRKRAAMGRAGRG